MSLRGLALALTAAIAVGRPLDAGAEPQTFLRLESRLAAALAGVDRAEVDRLWDDEFVFVFPSGGVSRKADRLAGLQAPADPVGPKLVAQNDSVEVAYEDPCVAVVIVRSSWRLGDAAPEHYVATHIWTKRPRGWRLLSAQVAKVSARS